MATLKWICLILAVPAALCAQGRGAMFPWWENPVVNSLDLTDTQRGQIREVVREYRGKMFEVRAAVDKAESELEEVFNDESIDQRKGDEAIDRLVKARSEMTKAVSEMSLRLRAVLTPQQWQDLQKRQQDQPGIGRDVGRGTGRGPDRGGPGRRRGGPKGRSPAAEQQTPTQPVVAN
jgi:Spy/CpxP family protein refolding chaperone